MKQLKNIIHMSIIPIIVTVAAIGIIVTIKVYHQQKNKEQLVHMIVIGQEADKHPEIWIDKMSKREVCSTMLIMEGYAKNGNFISVGCFDSETNKPIPGLTKPEIWPQYVTDYERKNIYKLDNQDLSPLQ